MQLFYKTAPNLTALSLRQDLIDCTNETEKPNEQKSFNRRFMKKP